MQKKKTFTKKEVKKIHIQIPTEPKNTFIDTIEHWLQKNENKIYTSLFLLCIMSALLLFRVRIDEGGDDSNYIEGGYRYATNFFHYYFSFQATGYPLFLAIPISFFGIHVILLKCLSLIFYGFAFYFFYKTVRGKIPYIITFPALYIIAFNKTSLFFASQTYSEAFFMMFLAMFFFVFFRFLEFLKFQETSLRITSKKEIFFVYGLCLLIFACSFVKTAGIVVLFSTLIYFLFQKQFINGLKILTMYGLIKILYEIIKITLWGELATSNSSQQAGTLLQKHPYDSSQGTEDMYGFIIRLLENTELYLGKRFMESLYILSPDFVNRNPSHIIYIVLSLFIVILFSSLFINSFLKKQKLYFFLSLFLFCALGFTFLVLQPFWEQIRLITPYFFIILLTLFLGIYTIFSKKLPFFYVFFICIILLCNTIGTIKAIKSNIPTLIKNLKGDKYAGYTEDWVNYLKMSEWCGKNLSPQSVAVCRKASMSFIYSDGKKFYPMYKTPYPDPLFDNMTHPDSAFHIIQKNGITHIILANLRSTGKKDGNIINTIHRFLIPFSEKYPQKLKLIRTEGTEEPCYLYEIIQ
ncbi:MAG: hypothetical protein QM536_05155 [Chitinophagaceae bacterium]|nr:hypothetical protein [Chitinophagaceae bacterium]